MDGNVLTLVAAEPGPLVESWADAAARALEKLGALLGGTAWLAPKLACDIAFDGLDPDQAEAAARGYLAMAPVDLIAQNLAGRKKRLLLADMESTIIANEMLDEIADLVGIKAKVAAITRRAMNDEIDFVGALKERVALLKDKPASLLEEAGKRIRITPGAKELVSTMRANGATTALVSGGFSVYSVRIREELGFDLDFANELVISRDKIAGTVREPIKTGDNKLETLTRLAAECGCPLALTLAVGDGSNDLPMLGAAGLGIAFHGQPHIAPRARHRVDHADLTTLLYAQGYRRDEFVADDGRRRRTR
jgi:phosphoserine phosphatase